MRISLIIDDAIFFLPDYANGIIKEFKKSHAICSMAILSTPLSHSTIYSYIIKNIWRIAMVQKIKLFKEFFTLQLKRLLFELYISRQPVTLSQVGRYHHIPLKKIKNVNDPFFLSRLKEMNIDIIISSCSGIFKKEILRLPRIACINRHSALLPAYGGLFPIFQAMIHREKKIGVTIHNMTDKIDEGEIVLQRIIPVVNGDSLFSLYKKSYKESVRATVDAVEILEKKIKPKVKIQTKKSYFSYPGDKDWKIFFDQKNAFI